jgi:CubicO group peptidase (beta-lactamase class C family)
MGRLMMQKLFLGTLLAGLVACGVDIDAEIDQLFQGYAGDGMPGASVMVIKDGQPILTKSYGLAIVEDGVPVRPETNFRLASMTKQFTATSVLMLVDQGKLGLDDSIRKYFPEFPAFADGITIRNLLQHTSGIEDYEPIYGDRFPEQVTDRGVVEIISKTGGTMFPPGSKYSYSNSGYAILAVLVENLSGKKFPQFLRDNIFVPLEMMNTVALVEGVTKVPNRSFGYTVSDTGVEFSDQSAWSAVLGDGGVYSSVEDLFKWDQALYENGLISAELRAQSWTPGLETYGFGFRIDEYKGHRRYHHSGSTSGYRNHMQQFPDDRLTIIILTNRAEPDVEPLAEKIADLYL